MTEFMGITLDEKFWVLIAFIIFVLVVGKKATKATNEALDARSNAILDKINISENIKKEIDRKNISADKEIEYMHIEAVNNIKNKITDITLRSVEEVAVTEFNNDKSKNIFDEF